MIKIDLEKAYDSMEWTFIKQILKELEFQSRMVTWIMLRINTTSYTFKVNVSLSETI